MSAASSAAAAPVAPASVDVAAIVDQAAAAKGEKLDWRHSIVDLMKALDIDSSLAARKELADELGYGGDTGDSASMNIWLHTAGDGQARRQWRQAAAGDQALSPRSRSRAKKSPLHAGFFFGGPPETCGNG